MDWKGIGLEGSTVFQQLCSVQGHQDCVQVVLECLQWEEIRRYARVILSGLVTYIQAALSVYQYLPVASCPITWHHWEEAVRETPQPLRWSVPVLSHLRGQWETCIKNQSQEIRFETDDLKSVHLFMFFLSQSPFFSSTFLSRCV